MQRYPMGGFPASGPIWNGASDLLGHLEWGEFFGDVLHAGFVVGNGGVFGER